MAELKAVDPAKPEPNIILKAAGILKTGGLVAFPTETVYGLGADATNPDAIRRIYQAKGRPPTNPLIVHCESVERISRDCVATWPTEAQTLADAFWPGPLTLVLPKSSQIPEIATAGLGSVGVRIPESTVARALIAATDRPIAAPSANRSNRISPTLAQHVADDLGDRIEMILDAGPCRAGLESTVLDLSGRKPVILRPGPITAAQISAVLGRPVEIRDEFLNTDVAHAAPGQSRVHYAPSKPLELWLGQRQGAGPKLGSETAVLVLGETAGVLDLSQSTVYKWITVPGEAQHRLYALLHEWDRDALVQRIVVLLPNPTPDWAAVLNRLTRAAVKIVQ